MKYKLVFEDPLSTIEQRDDYITDTHEMLIQSTTLLGLSSMLAEAGIMLSDRARARIAFVREADEGERNQEVNMVGEDDEDDAPEASDNLLHFAVRPTRPN